MSALEGRRRTVERAAAARMKGGEKIGKGVTSLMFDCANDINYMD
jgi:hypothetical protein